jgi:hypothetical protein
MRSNWQERLNAARGWMIAAAIAAAAAIWWIRH